MKDYLKHLWSRKGKLALLIGVLIFTGLVEYNLLSDEKTSTGLIVGASAFCGLLIFMLNLQAWREYKGYEGLFGRK